jgi:hypothetical protein
MHKAASEIGSRIVAFWKDGGNATMQALGRNSVVFENIGLSGRYVKIS